MHNINFNEASGEHSFYSTREKAWHGFGQIGQGYKNSREVVVQSHLNYKVIKAGNTHIIPSCDPILSDTSFFTYREDTNDILGDKIGGDYVPLQNDEAFAFFDELAGESNILYETAGALGKGERIFITAKLPSHIQVASNDLLEKYLFMYNSHDGTGAIIIAFTPIRIVCNNTLNAALKDCERMVKIRHTAAAAQKLAMAKNFLGICDKFSEQFGEMMRQWTKIRITDQQVLRLVEMAMAPTKETLDAVLNGNRENLSHQFLKSVNDTMKYRFSNETQLMESTQGTLFGAYNAVTGYFQNVRKYKTSEQQFTSIMEGTSSQYAQKAFNLCLSYANDGADALMMN